MDARIKIGIGLAASLALAIAVQALHWGDALDRKAMDAEFKFLRDHYPRPVKNDVVIVGIDEAAYTTFREPFAMWHPHLGKFLRAMAMAKPAVVGLDITLPDRSYHFLVPQYDQSLLEGLIAANAQAPVVLGQNMSDNGQFRSVFPPYVAVTGGDSLGSVMVCTDADGVIRRFEGNLCDEGPHAISLTEKMAGHLGLKQESHGWIDFGVGDAFTYVPFLDVLRWEEEGNVGQLEKVFGGRPVLLGAVLPFDDRIRAPVSLAGWEQDNRKLPGVLLHGQIFRSIQGNGLVRAASPIAIWSLTLVAALFWLGRNGWAKAGLLGAFLLSITGISLLELAHTHYLPLGSILFVALAAFTARMAYDAFAEMKERRLLRGTFGSYVSPQVMQEIMAGNIKPGLGGTRRRVCILFSDIRNFTTRSEGMEPEDVIEMLNGYFTDMTSAIHQHGGTVDKFIGDGIMAFFGAPQSLDCPEKSAFAAAKEMLSRLETVNQRLHKKGLDPIRIGIGIHIGEVVIGHVGSEMRHEYTAIGDAVNLASRLEGLSKDVGYAVVCSEAVAHGIGAEAGLDDLGEQPVKGHSMVRAFGWGRF